MRSGDFGQDLARFRDIAIDRDADPDAKAHARVTMAPVDHRLFDKVGVGNDNRDVVVGQDGGAPGTDVFNLAGHGAHFDPVADLDGTFREHHQSADEITGDVLQSEADPDADRAREDCQGRQIQPCALQRDKNANGQHQITTYLRDGVLQRTIQAALAQEPVEKEPLRRRGEPENDRNQCDELEDLDKA
jgi:hypothetical protein